MLLTLSLLLSCCAWAQSGAAAQQDSSPSAQERRRAELREVLKRPLERHLAATTPAPAATPEPRRLSPQERADLRQTLRQQRSDERAQRQ